MKKITLLIILISLSISAQKIKFSGEFDHTMSKGFEIKNEFIEKWYISFYAENIYTNVNEFAYGFNIGCYNELKVADFYYGLKVGIMNGEKSKPVYGVNAGLDLNTFDNFYIGVKAEYFLANNGVGSDNNITVITFPRLSFKFGIKF